MEVGNKALEVEAYRRVFFRTHNSLPTFFKVAVHDSHFSMLRDGEKASANNADRPIEDERLRIGVNVITLWPGE